MSSFFSNWSNPFSSNPYYLGQGVYGPQSLSRRNYPPNGSPYPPNGSSYYMGGRFYKKSRKTTRKHSGGKKHKGSKKHNGGTRKRKH